MNRSLPGKIAGLLACAAAVWLAGTVGPLSPYVQAVKQERMEVQAVTGDRSALSLRAWIEQEAQRRRIEPSNAVVDRVWKAIPGYNGREVDVAATYAKANAAGLPPGAPDFPWVYRELPPSVTLAQLPVQPTYRGHPAKPMAAFMINVAWGDEYLPAMLDTLDAAGVKATFFLDGSWLAKHPDTAKDMLARGHELSNHAYTHPDMPSLSYAAQKREIGRTEELLRELGVRNRWFAPPSGAYDAATVKAAGEFGLRTVLWTVDTVDWRNPPPAAIVDKIARRVGPGHLILMHPTSSSSQALKGMIAAIQAKGYRLGTVSETLSERRVPSG